VLQQLWLHFRDKGENARRWTIGGIAAVVVLIAAAFVFFYPVLAAVPLSWNQWHLRMWFPTWIVGPG
jgi:dolichyl-phosphate-mannose--protein O-mannosyl transferase